MMIKQAGIEVVKVAPPAAVCFICDFVSDLDNDIKVLTLLYVFIQISYLLWKWRKEAKAKGKTKKVGDFDDPK